MKQEQNLKRAQIFRFTQVKLMNPPIETARALNDLYTFECSQWVPIRNSQIIGRYKEIIGRYKEILKWAQIFRFTRVKLMTPPVSSKSWKWYTALHSMQLYISVVTMNCVIWSWASGQVSHALLFYHVVVVVIVYYTTAYRCCCCVLHISNKNNYKIHRNWLWSLC